MTYEPRLIAPFENSGLKKWYKPWLIGQEAFPQLADAYARRGVVRKREGFLLYASLPTESGSPPPVVGLKSWINPASFSERLIAFSRKKSYIFSDAGQSFGNMTFYAYPTGVAVAVTGAEFSFHNGTNDYFWSSNYRGCLWVTNNLTTDNINFWNGTAGVVNVSGGWSAFVPVVDGAPTYITAALIVIPYKGRLVALKVTENGGTFTNRARWSQYGTPFAGAAIPVAITTFTAANPTAFTTASDLFTTGQNISFFSVTGADAALLNGVNGTITRVGAGSYTVNINTAAKAINNSGFVQQLGNPPSGQQLDINAWRSDIPGKGGFNDADTSESIVSAAIIKDTLIVFFQRSTWRLQYTGNQVLPFIWQRLNTQYGSESPYSVVSFDEAAITFSRYGWIASDTNDVARIDLDIPDDSFQFEGVNMGISGINKVQGIRDFYRNFAYFTYIPIGQSTATQIYGYNYIDKSWTIFNPQQGSSGSSTPLAINCFGTYRNTRGDFTWAALNTSTDTWSNYNDENDKWENFGDGQNIDFPYVLGGDLNGNVYLMFEFFQTPTSDNGTAFNFSIFTKRFNPYIKDGMKCRLGYVDLYCTTLAGGEITVNHYTDDQETPIFTRTVEIFSRGVTPVSAVSIGTTTTITTVSSHNLQIGESVVVADMSGNINKTINADMSFVVSAVPTATSFTIPVDTNGSTYTFGGLVYSEENYSGDARYTRIYLGAIAHMHQLQFTLSYAQLTDVVKGVAQFEMQGLVVWTRPAGKIRG